MLLCLHTILTEVTLIASLNFIRQIDVQFISDAVLNVTGMLIGVSCTLTYFQCAVTIGRLSAPRTFFSDLVAFVKKFTAVILYTDTVP